MNIYSVVVVDILRQELEKSEMLTSSSEELMKEYCTFYNYNDSPYIINYENDSCFFVSNYDNTIITIVKVN